MPSIPSRTPKRWPDADILAQYLREFARTQEDAGRIQYATSVDQVRRDSKTGEFMMDVEPSALDGESAPWYFDKEYRHEDSRRNTKGLRGVVKCGKLVMACGLWEPNVLPMVGIDLAEGYETLPESGAKFEGKTIAIMGMGNSAFEAAKSFDDYTNFVHIWPTRGKPPWPWVSWESRYSGSLRANTAGSLDGYLLDTLDALGLSDYVVANPKRMMIVKCLGDQLCLFNRNTNPDTGDHVALLGYYDPASPFQAAFVANMTNMGLTAVINREVSINQNRVARVTTDAEAGISVDDSKLKIPARNIVVFADNITEDNVDLIMEYRHHTGDNLASPYDHIIRATGWRHNTSLTTRAPPLCCRSTTSTLSSPLSMSLSTCLGCTLPALSPTARTLSVARALTSRASDTLPARCIASFRKSSTVRIFGTQRRTVCQSSTRSLRRTC